VSEGRNGLLPLSGEAKARNDIYWTSPSSSSTSEEPIFDLADFIVSADTIYCLNKQKLAFSKFI
jgi:hypothetical protein